MEEEEKILIYCILQYEKLDSQIVLSIYFHSLFGLSLFVSEHLFKISPLPAADLINKEEKIQRGLLQVLSKSHSENIYDKLFSTLIIGCLRYN